MTGTRDDGDGDPSPAAEPLLEVRLRKAAIVFAVLAAAVLVTTLAVLELRSRGSSGVSGFEVADFEARAQPEDGPAARFELPPVKGSRTVSLASYQGKVIVLNFWASWCAPCWKEASGLQRTWERYRARGVQFVGVNERDNLYAARSFLEENSVTFPSAFDGSGRLAFTYELTGMPTTFVIDRDGLLVYRFLGYLDERTLVPALDALLKEPA